MHIASEAALSELKRSSRKTGAKALKKALHAGIVRRVFLAMDADPGITEPIAALCAQMHVECLWASSMKLLGQACGIDVGAAAAAITDPDSNG